MKALVTVAPFWTRTDLGWLPGHARLAQSILLEEASPSRLVTGAISVLVVSVAAFVLWAGLTPVTEVASASGEVSPVGTVRKIQHLEGGIVAAIHVRDGDAVEAGQVVMRLEEKSSLPELQQQRSRLASLQLAKAQLAAYRAGRDEESPEGASAYGSIAAAQRNLLRDKRAALSAQEALFREQLRQRQAELASLQTQVVTVRDQLALVGEQVATRQGLVDKGLAPRMTLLDLQRDRARIRTLLAETEGQISRSERAVGEAEARIEDLRARTLRESAEEAAKIESDLSETRAAIERAQDRVERLTVRSPVRGVVKGLQTETLGAVVLPGSTLLEVIPSDVPMVVDARLQTKDIGFVHVGQPVAVKITAFDYTRFGAAEGRVETLSATTFQDDKGNPYYRARISLASSHLPVQPDRTRIVPGMTVTADVTTGRKSVLSYLLRPILRATSEALHER